MIEEAEKADKAEEAECKGEDKGTNACHLCVGVCE